MAVSQALSQSLQLSLEADKQVIVRDRSGQESAEWQKLSGVASVQPGDAIRYTLRGVNNSDRPQNNLVLTQPIPPQTVYILNSATGTSSATIAYSIDNGQNFVTNPTIQVTSPDGRVSNIPAPPESYTHIRWTFGQSLAPAAVVVGQFDVTVK